MQIEDIKVVAVIGAGIMGHGIAQVCARAGYNVYMMARHRTTLVQALEKIELNIGVLVEENVLSSEEAEITLMRIKTTTDILKATEKADLVIETVPELIESKKEIFEKLDRLCPKHTILATNTTGFKISEIAQFTNRPANVVGTHFWNPPSIIPLVEVVKGPATSDETVKVTKEFVEKIGKVPVICKDKCIGPILQSAFNDEAMRILEEGLATPQEIDMVVKLGFGLRLPIIGPLETADYGGLDTWLYTRENRYKQTGVMPPGLLLLRQKVEKGELGIKTGKGFYDYTAQDINSLLRKRYVLLIRLLKTLEVL